MHYFFFDKWDIKKLVPDTEEIKIGYMDAIITHCANSLGTCARETRQFKTHNHAFFEKDNKGNRFLDFVIDRRYDAITDLVTSGCSALEVLVDSNAKTISNSNDIVLLPMCCQYSEFRVRLKFPKEIPKEFSFSYTGYILPQDVREDFMTKDIRTPTHRYVDGVVY